MSEEEKKNDPLEPYSSAPIHIQNIMKKVLKLENDKLYQQTPHVTSDIINIIKEEIK